MNSDEEFLKEQGRRLDAALEAALSGAALTPTSDPLPLATLLVRIELEALNVAREEMRKDGIHPSVPAGVKMTLELARVISRHLRERLGIPADPEAVK